MARLTAGSLVGFDNLDLPLALLRFIAFIEREPGYVSGDFRELDAPELTAELFGTGFRYGDTGALVAGTVTGLRLRAFGETYFTLQELSIGVPRLVEIIFADDESGWAAVLAGNDTLIGSPLDDHLRAYDGDDRVTGGPGNDIIDGGSGFDRVVVVGDASPGDTLVVVWNGMAATVPLAGKAGAIDGVDRLPGVEAVSFERADGSVVATQAIGGDNFSPLQYLASYGDLADAFGTAHFVVVGFGEGRAAETFDAAQYLANYADLRAAFGADEQAATLHFITSGFAERRNDDRPATEGDFLL